MKKTLLAFTTLAMLTFASCEKEDEETEETTPTANNLAGTYKITAVTAGGVNVFDNSNASFNVFEACDRDDEYKLNANLTYQVVDAGVVCSPSNNTSGTWAISGTTITILGETSTVESFNGRTLVLTKTFQGTTIKSTLVKQ